VTVQVPGDYSLGFSFPYNWDEYEVVPVIYIWIEYYRCKEYIDKKNPALMRSKCLFQVKLNGQDDISLPGVGYLLVRTMILVVDPVSVDLKQGSQDGVDQYSSKEWNDAQKSSNVSEEQTMIIDLSTCSSFLDVLIALVHEEEIKHRVFFFIRFSTHENVGYITKSRLNVLGDTSKLKNMSEAELMQFFNGGYSPRYGTWIDLSKQKPQDRKSTIEEFKFIDGP
jgi:hypothetical protein